MKSAHSAFTACISSYRPPYARAINPVELLRAVVRRADLLSEKLIVEVAHFEPVEFRVIGNGVYPSVALTLPRDVPSDWTVLLEKAKEILSQGIDALLVRASCRLKAP